MTLQLIIPPEELPVSLAEAKLHLREEDDLQNTLIETYIAAATYSAETYLSRSLVAQTWDYYAGAFPVTGGIEIPRPPVISVLGVFYSDGGSEQEFPASSYQLDRSGLSERVSLVGTASWPTATATRIRFRAGYLDPLSPDVTSVPADIKAAILLTVGHLFTNRESVVVGTSAMELPRSSQALLRLRRFDLGMA
jgi:uncharacterized phiE125 gp8 family phage protein